jgi:phosphatidylglycerophosphate synthase
MSASPAFAFFTLPNLLTLARLPLGWLFWVVLGRTADRALPALGILALAAVTDMLDGPLARRRGADAGGPGAWLDPTCDKLFMAGVLGGLHFERGVSLALLAMIVARELLQLPMVIVYRLSAALRRWLRYDFHASPIGKTATIIQFLTISALILRLPARALALMSCLLGLTALGTYVWRAVVLGRARLQAAGGPSRP